MLHGKCYLCKEVGWTGCPATCTPPAETLALLSEYCFVLHGMFSERGLAVNLVGGKIHWMEEFDFLLFVKAANVRNSLWIRHVFHRIIICIEVMLHSNPHNQIKVRVFFFFPPEQIHWKKKSCSSSLNDSTFLNCLFVNTSVRGLGNPSV